jgi:hypothetical protein
LPGVVNSTVYYRGTIVNNKNSPGFTVEGEIRTFEPSGGRWDLSLAEIAVGFRTADGQEFHDRRQHCVSHEFPFRSYEDSPLWSAICNPADLRRSRRIWIDPREGRMVMQGVRGEAFFRTETLVNMDSANASYAWASELRIPPSAKFDAELPGGLMMTFSAADEGVRTVHLLAGGIYVDDNFSPIALAIDQAWTKRVELPEHLVLQFVYDSGNLTVSFLGPSQTAIARVSALHCIDKEIGFFGLRVDGGEVSVLAQTFASH